MRHTNYRNQKCQMVEVNCSGHSYMTTIWHSLFVNSETSHASMSKRYLARPMQTIPWVFFRIPKYQVIFIVPLICALSCGNPQLLIPKCPNYLIKLRPWKLQRIGLYIHGTYYHPFTVLQILTAAGSTLSTRADLVSLILEPLVCWNT